MKALCPQVKKLILKWGFNGGVNMTKEPRANEFSVERLVSQKGKWLEEYGCGCTLVTKYKKELIGYCGIHGQDRINIYKLPEETECGLG